MEARTGPTRKFLAGLSPDEFPVLATSMPADEGRYYGGIFRMLWVACWLAERPIILIEHDILPTIAGLREIAACPHLLCAYAYRLYSTTTNLPGEVWVHRHAEGDVRACRWGDYGEEWASFAGFGLVKFSALLREKYPPGWRDGPWWDLDTRFFSYMHAQGQRVHMHWPEVVHNHK